MRWYVNQAGTAKGPIEETELIKAIQAGTIAPSDTVCVEGSEEWATIGEHPQLAAQLPTPQRLLELGATHAGARRPRATGWEITSTIVASLALAGVGLIAWQMYHLHELAVSRANAALRRGDSILAELQKSNALPSLLQLSDVPHYCSGWESEFRCTFTNPTAMNVATCAAGRLTRRDNAGATVDSAMLCSGRISPFESKTVSVPWLGKNADDVCFTKSPWGGTRLDWKVCDFQITGPKPNTSN